jgi:hypothetical protein
VFDQSNIKWIDADLLAYLGSLIVPVIVIYALFKLSALLGIIYALVSIIVGCVVYFVPLKLYETIRATYRFPTVRYRKKLLNIITPTYMLIISVLLLFLAYLLK